MNSQLLRRTRRAGLLMAAMLLASACSSGAASSPPVASTAPTAAAPSAQGSAPAASPSAAAGSIPVTFGAFITPSLTKEVWEGIVASFEAKNPDVKVSIVYPPASEADVNGYWKTLLAAGKMPDVITNIIPADFIKANALYAFPTDDPDVQRIPDVPALLVDGKLYTLGSMAQPLSLMYYNKDAFTKAGITQPPTTVAELNTDLAALKTSGAVPMTTAGDSLAYIQWNSFTSADVFGQDPHWFTDRRAGTVHYADGTNLQWAQTIADWVKNDYFPKGAAGLTYDQSTKDFLDGKAAMIANGVWFAAQVASTKTPFEVGVFAVPNQDAKGRMASGQDSFCSVWANSPQLEGAKRLCKFISFDADGHGVLMTTDGDLSALKDPPEYKKSPLQAVAADLLQKSSMITILTNGLGDEKAVPGLFDAVVSAWQGLLTGQDATKTMKDLDTFWDQKQAAGG